MKKTTLVAAVLLVSLIFLLFQETTLLNTNNQLTGLSVLNYKQLMNQQLSIAIPITLLSLAAVIYLLAVVLRSHTPQHEVDKFIENARKEGHNDKEITEMLIENGWPSEKVVEFLR